MKDDFQLREDSNVAWLEFLRELGTLAETMDAEVLKLTFKAGYAKGWMRGAEMEHAGAMAAMDRMIEKSKGVTE